MGAGVGVADSGLHRGGGVELGLGIFSRNAVPQQAIVLLEQRYRLRGGDAVFPVRITGKVPQLNQARLQGYNRRARSTLAQVV